MNSVSNAESAKNIGYDNSESGLTATDVQGAVDELKSGLIKSVPAVITLTTDASGNAQSDPINILHPNLNILGIIIGYNYKSTDGSIHSNNVYFYAPPGVVGDIRIANDPHVNTSFVIIYTILYT